MATYMQGVSREAGMSERLPVANAYVISVQLQTTVGAELWKHGSFIPTEQFNQGTIFLGHLGDEPTAYMPNEFECVMLMIPQVSLLEIGADMRGGMNTLLEDVNRAEDPVLYHLGMAIKLAMLNPATSGRLFVDQVSLAVCTHLCATYGSRAASMSPTRRGLSRREERMAKELLTADLGAEPSLAEVAAACGIPVRRFADAFRVTTGMPPFRWLRGYRVERAKLLLVDARLSLAEIAYGCGFADQSHFTRVFSAATGVTPAVWRKSSVV